MIWWSTSHDVKEGVEVTTKLMSPEQFFGYRLGSDRKIARWDRIVEYYYHLASASDRIKVQEIGKSTEGNPFLLVVISAPENLANLEHLRQVNLKISDPRGLTEEHVKALINEGRAVVCQSMSLHGNEIGGTQMSPELAHDLVSSVCEDDLRILKNVIFLLVPCFNPDGQIMITDWYDKYLGTEYEGSGMPWLYQKYTGHDNNRDAFMLNIPESQHVAKILFRDWIPQVYQDHHHMGSNGIRFYIAPYSDPIRPNADPLVWREISWYGSHMAYKLEEAGKAGVIGGSHWSAWGHLGFHRITVFHNIAGLLTESASAKMATPMYVHPNQLVGCDAKTHPRYEAQTNFPNPWPGGWWRLRDIVEQQKISSWALLDIAARYRETVLRNAYVKAKHQTDAGRQAKPIAYVIPREQHDPLTALRLVRLLLDQGVEVKVARAQFEAGGRVYPAKSHVVFLDQPKMGLIKVLLARTLYPDAYWTRNPDGSPMVYDLAADAVPEYMGVTVTPVDDCCSGDFEVVTEPAWTASTPCTACAPCVPCSSRAADEAKAGYVLDGRLNDSFTTVGHLVRAGATVSRLDAPVCAGQKALPAGAFYIQGDLRESQECGRLAKLAPYLHGVSHTPAVAMHKTGYLRVGVYQRYWGGNMDEGWTRYVFDRFGIPYVTLMDADFQHDLREKVDVLVLPSDRKALIIGPDKIDRNDPAARPFARVRDTVVPPEYRSGIGKEGASAIKEFARGGGRLVALDHASEFAIDVLGLKVRNVVAGMDFRSFYCHGSTLCVKVDNTHPVGYGMPRDAFVFNLDSPTFDIYETFSAEDYDIIAQYPERDVLQSGWLIGEDKIAGKAALVAAQVGKGQAILFGFRPQFRGQTHGTYKLLFNCLLE